VDVRVEHWWGRLPLDVVDGLDGPREGVTRVYVSRGRDTMVLAGRDVYWVAGDRFGCFNDPENHHRWGRGVSGWRWPQGGNPHRDGRPPPSDAVMWRGVMLPDDEAREVGLL